MEGNKMDADKKINWLIRFLILMFITLVWAVPMEQTSEASGLTGTQSPKIGLVLSGGGARGAAHIGVIKILEELRVPVDFIAGTSMGSIVGGLYASGMGIKEIETVLTTIDWDEVLMDTPPRQDRSFHRKRDDDLYLVKAKPGFNNGSIDFPSGLIQGQKIDLLFKSLTLPVSQIDHFDNLSIPFRAVATDIVTGRAVILDSGDLGMAMRASMSVPAAFAAVEIDGKLLVDGGIANNLPINIVRKMGSDIVIAVDISTPLLDREKLKGALSIASQLTGILTRRNTEEQIASLTDRDVLIIPNLGDITTTDFKRAGEAIPKGIEAAELKRKELEPLGLPESTYTAHLSVRSDRDKTLPVVHFIRLDNRSSIGDDLLYAYLNVETDKPLDIEKLEAAIGRIYGLELFESVRYDIVTENGQTGLVIHAREKSWGPNYLQFGAAFTSTSDGGSHYNIALAYQKTGLNSRGGEAKIAVQLGQDPGMVINYFQYLDVNSNYFVEPQLSVIRDTVNIYEKDHQSAEYRNTRWLAEFALGRETGTWGELRAGYRWYTGDADVRVGDPGLRDYEFDGGELFVRLSHDKLNDRNFPTSGSIGTLEWTGSRKDLGADSDFDQVTAQAFGAASWGRNTLFGGGQYYTTLDNDAPIQNLFNAGGIFNLSGYNENELTGQHFAIIKAGLYRRLGDFKLMPVYVGADLEIGNVWQNDKDIGFDNTIVASTIFLGIDTILGPLFIGYGHAEGGRDAVYFILGEVFGSN